MSHWKQDLTTVETLGSTYGRLLWAVVPLTQQWYLAFTPKQTLSTWDWKISKMLQENHNQRTIWKSKEQNTDQKLSSCDLILKLEILPFSTCQFLVPTWISSHKMTIFGLCFILYRKTFGDFFSYSKQYHCLSFGKILNHNVHTVSYQWFDEL